MNPLSQLSTNVRASPMEVSRDGTVVLDLAGDRLLKLSPVAAKTWELLGAGCSESEIIDSIVEEYGIDRKRATADISHFARQIADLGVVADPPLITAAAPRAAADSALPSFRWYGQDKS